MATTNIEKDGSLQQVQGSRLSMGMHLSGLINSVLLNAILLFGVFLTAAPYIYMIVGSFKPNTELWSWPIQFYPRTLVDPSLYPGQVTEVLGFIPLYLENYRWLFREQPYWRWFFNSFFLAAAQTSITLFLTSLAGFAFAKYDFRFKKAGFLLVLVSIMLPGQILLMPMFIQMAFLNWLNTYWAIMVPFAASPFAIFLMRQFMLSVPDELMDAARIDGSTEFGIFWRIVVHIQKPAFGILAIITFNGAFTDFLWPLIVLSSKKLYTLNLGLAILRGPYQTPYGAILAGSFLGTLPIVIVFLFMQRQFIAGLTAGALKE
jgi:ABC-type glycerol-3-phosphate transport system permease component